MGFEGVGGEFEKLEFVLGSLDFPAALTLCLSSSVMFMNGLGGEGGDGGGSGGRTVVGGVVPCVVEGSKVELLVVSELLLLSTKCKRKERRQGRVTKAKSGALISRRQIGKRRQSVERGSTKNNTKVSFVDPHFVLHSRTPFLFIVVFIVVVIIIVVIVIVIALVVVIIIVVIIIIIIIGFCCDCYYYYH